MPRSYPGAFPCRFLLLIIMANLRLMIKGKSATFSPHRVRGEIRVKMVEQELSLAVYGVMDKWEAVHYCEVFAGRFNAESASA